MVKVNLLLNRIFSMFACGMSVGSERWSFKFTKPALLCVSHKMFARYNGYFRRRSKDKKGNLLSIKNRIRIRTKITPSASNKRGFYLSAHTMGKFSSVKTEKSIKRDHSRIVNTEKNKSTQRRKTEN